jgi:hypothetical protein
MDKVITNAVTGEVTVVPFTPEEEAAHLAWVTSRAWEKLRDRRNALLIESDAYVLPDRWSGYTPDQQSAWTAYRQELRDLPANTNDPVNPVWPVKP